MSQSNCSPSLVHQMFHSLLTGANPPDRFKQSIKNASETTEAPQRSSEVPQRPSEVPQRSSEPPQRSSEPPQRLSQPPQRYSVRFIENDENGRREKYDGSRWRLVCTWNTHECTNFAYTYQLCAKHNAIRLNKPPKQKKKKLLTHSSLPIMNNRKSKHINGSDDDDIEIIEELCKAPKARFSMNTFVKSEAPDFKIFSVDHVDDMDIDNTVKREPKVSSSYEASSSDEIEFLSAKVRTNGVNVKELLSKNIPPLTEFEEEYMATRLMEKLPSHSSMLDAQLFLHNEAIAVVKRNYRLKMETIAPEYFYDFLLRHPQVALHYRRWFLRFKPVPPSTGCPIDTKAWTLSMIVRGAMATNGMIDECDE